MRRGKPTSSVRATAPARKATEVGFVPPMLATAADLASVPVTGQHLVYERKYDGMRAIAAVVPAGPGGENTSVTIWSRSGADKTAQFPEVAGGLAALGAARRRPLVLDGEIVAVDERGRPADFSHLQARMHLAGTRAIAQAVRRQPVVFYVFDLLRDGDESLVALPWAARRERLERLFRRSSRGETGASAGVRLSEIARGDGRRMVARAASEGWEGLVVKEVASPYEAGRRSPRWRKLKILTRQEFVVGGFTEGQGARTALGALLLGVWQDTPGTGRHLRYVGGVGTGFDRATLARLARALRSLETDASPFAGPVEAAGRVHWVRPAIVVEVRFAQWTPDGRLRHPVFLGWREDKPAGQVVREATPSAPAPAARGNAIAPVLDRLRALEEARRNGWVTLPDGTRLYVTNLWKVYWPELGLTKGDLLRYYAEISPVILPVLDDRPLVLERYPDGIEGEAFHQQRVQHRAPPGVRREVLPEGADPQSEAGAGAGRDERFIGGNLATLLYTAQLGAISQDPWFSTVRRPLEPCEAALDLDPGPEASWADVVDVARWTRDELVRLGVSAVPKTSGSRGLHLYFRLPTGTSYESALLFCQIVATLVATRHPRHATVERVVARRPPRAVYVDYLQNRPGKTLASAYSVRASAWAGVSTPLAWRELDEGVDLRAFTLRTLPARLRETGDLWARLRTMRPADLRAALERVAQSRGARP